MLENDYSSRFGQLIESLDWDIELPRDWSDYFQQHGKRSATFSGDARCNQRMMVRTHGVMWFEMPVPFRGNCTEPVGIYSRDFSARGIGFLTPFEVYPEEKIRIGLPAFWLEVTAVRARRITSRCYEIGADLIQRHDPDAAVFTGITASDSLSAATAANQSSASSSPESGVRDRLPG